MFSPSYLNRSWSIHRRQVGFGWCTRLPVVVELANLNDACLSNILSFIELQELPQLRRVCTRWKRLIEQICHRTKRLTVSGTGVGTRHHHYGTSLILTKFEPATLAALFPHLQSLSITFDHKTSTDQLIRFLKLQPHLVELTLAGHAHLSTKAQLATLLQTINSLSHLTNLSLHLKNLLTETDLTANLIFTLPQLETLSLAECPFNLYPVLKQLKSIKSLSLTPLPVLTTSDVIKRAIAKNKQLQRGLVRLKLTGLKKDSDIVPVIAAKMLGLQVIDVNEIYLTSDLLKCFKKLKNLNTLALDTIRIDRKLYHTKFSPSQLVPNLTSLSLRNLFLLDDLYAQLLCRILSTVFPNLETVTISSFNACLLWELEKHRSMFAYCKHWKLIDLGASDPEEEEERPNGPPQLNGSFESHDLENESFLHSTFANDDTISFRSLAVAIERLQETTLTTRPELESILEREDSVD